MTLLCFLLPNEEGVCHGSNSTDTETSQRGPATHLRFLSMEVSKSKLGLKNQHAPHGQGLASPQDAPPPGGSDSTCSGRMSTLFPCPIFPSLSSFLNCKGHVPVMVNLACALSSVYTQRTMSPWEQDIQAAEDKGPDRCQRRSKIFLNELEGRCTA